MAENRGISRTTKYRLLSHLEQAEVITVRSRSGCTIKVTLTHWPHPPVMSGCSTS
jgi:DNA-binding transcriptional regulator YhcF (GntR family)